MNEREHIPVGECVRGHVYRIHSRNLSFGVFVPEKDDGFIGIREKAGSRYLFTEHHADTGGMFGTVRPLEDLGPLKDPRILLQEHLRSTCRYCGEPAESYEHEKDGEKVRGRRHLGGGEEQCPDPPDLLLQRNRPLYEALAKIEREAGKGASIEYVFVLMGGQLDADGDGWKPNTQFSGTGAGGVVGVFSTRGAVRAYVEDNPPKWTGTDGGWSDYEADSWTPYTGQGSAPEDMWITGPVAPDGRYAWRKVMRMRLKGDDYVW